MTTARTAAWLVAALIFGPAHTAALGAGVWCFRWAWRNERRHQKENGLSAAAT